MTEVKNRKNRRKQGQGDLSIYDGRKQEGGGQPSGIFTHAATLDGENGIEGGRARPTPFRDLAACKGQNPDSVRGR